MPIHTFEVITQLSKNRHEIFLFGCVNKNASFLSNWRFFKIKIIKIPYWPIRAVGEILFLLFLLFKLTKNLFIHRPDILYIRHGSLSITGTILGKIFRVPIFIEVNDILLKRTEFKKVSSVKSFWIAIYEKLSFSLADRIFPVTNNIACWIRKRYSVKRNCIVVIPNGVNPNRFFPCDKQKCREKYNFRKKILIIGYLGSLYHWAGIEYLIEAAKSVIPSFPNVIFVIGGGEEPYLSYLIRKVNKKNLEKHFKFFGSIKWDEASDFINTFDIGVAPVFFNNLDSGISSQKVFAYLSCGKPVIGSDIPGLGDMLEKEGVGMSFPMGDSAAMAKKITLLFIPNYDNC